MVIHTLTGGIHVVAMLAPYGARKDIQRQRMFGIRAISDHAMKSRLEAEGLEPVVCRSAVASPRTRGFIETVMRREIGRGMHLLHTHPFVQKYAKPGFVATPKFVDKRRLIFHRRSSLAFYWVDPVCYVIDNSSGDVRDALLPSTNERRFFPPSDPSSHFRQGIERIAPAILERVRHISALNENATAADPPPPFVRGIKRGEYRFTPRMPKWLINCEGLTALVIGESAEHQYEQACHAIERFVETSAIRKLPHAYLDPSLDPEIRNVLGDLLGCEAVLLPACPPINWEEVGLKKLPPAAQRWWDRFAVRADAQENGHSLFLIAPETARTLLEIVQGEPAASWRSRAMATRAGSVITLHWDNPFVPRLGFARY